MLAHYVENFGATYLKNGCKRVLCCLFRQGILLTYLMYKVQIQYEHFLKRLLRWTLTFDMSHISLHYVIYLKSLHFNDVVKSTLLRTKIHYWMECTITQHILRKFYFFFSFHISVQELSFEIRPISSPCWSTKRLFGSYGFNICPCSQTLFGKSQPMERKNRRCVDGTLFSYCQSHETWSYSLFF